MPAGNGGLALLFILPSSDQEGGQGDQEMFYKVQDSLGQVVIAKVVHLVPKNVTAFLKVAVKHYESIALPTLLVSCRDGYATRGGMAGDFGLKLLVIHHPDKSIAPDQLGYLFRLESENVLEHDTSPLNS